MARPAQLPDPHTDVFAALAHGDRWRLLRLIGSMPAGSADTVILAKRTGLTPRKVRSHTDRLVNAGLLARTRRVADGRGQPRFLYALAPVAEPLLAWAGGR